MNGSTAWPIGAIPLAISFACRASTCACWATRLASAAIWFGSMKPPPSGRLRRQELGMHDGAALGEQHAAHDLVGFRQAESAGRLVPERRYERVQVARIQAARRHRDARR